MKIIVVFKWAMNPQDARVGSDGATDWRGVKMSASDDDPAAIAVARDMAAAEGEIIGLTIGDGDAAWAAARGASSSVAVTDVQAGLDSASTGAILAAAVRHIGDADVVLIGDSVWDYGVVAALAGQLGWPTLANVVSATVEAGRLKVTRKTGRVTQVVDVTGPVFLAVAASRAEQHVPSMKDVLAARKKPVVKLTLADLDVTSAAMVISRGTKLPDTAPARIIDGADPAAAVTELLTALRTEGIL
ncbi:hypothetical protein [Sodalis sp. dw_96]|uniref:electron transfer flavoprotein subunit beta/FixA family protein n=1 Tax=Sodalis sp. dw_96 TaxID=2719794 RepID=UPI001BD2678C|nr:hypothetical protein [Sodalis sp. dw_96]